MFNQQPRSAFAPAEPSRAHEHPRAFQFGAVQRELQITLLQCRVHIGHFRRPRAAVPNHHRAAAILALRNYALEPAVFDGVILHLHGQALNRRIERRPLWHRPREQHAIPLQAEIVMQMRGLMFLNDVGERFAQ